MKRIAIITDDYMPDSTRNHARMLHELALELLERNHTIIVITPGTYNQSNACEVSLYQGIEVWRFRSFPIRSKSRFIRAINETFLSAWAIFAIIVSNKTVDFDLCVNYSPSIFFGPLANWLQKRGARVYLVLRDLFPHWAIDQGLISKSSAVATYFRFFEHLNYRSANTIGVQSPANVEIFKQITNHKFKNVEVLYNWSNGALIDDANNFGKQLITKLNLLQKVVFFYGGNIGIAQDFNNIMRLAQSMECVPSAHFLLLGQGSEFDNVVNEVTQLNLRNVTVLPAVSQSDYSSILSNVHVGLFSLSKAHTSHNFPGKILGYMASRLPILGSVNHKNDIKELINESKSGLISTNGDDQDFFYNARFLALNADARRVLGESAYSLLKTTFSVTNAADTILSAAALNSPLKSRK